MIKLPDELNTLIDLANQLKGEKWTYSRTTPYSRGYITGNGGRTIVQTYDGEVPANVCRYFELADPATILGIVDKLQRLNATAQPVSDGWVKGRFSYDALFNAIAKSVNINSENSISISVKAFEEAMLAAAPGGQDD